MNSQPKKRVIVYLDPVLYQKLEQERGLVKRSTFIEDLVKDRLEEKRKRGIVDKTGTWVEL